MKLKQVLERIDAVLIPDEAIITQLLHEEDGEPYQVWKIDTGYGQFILKEAKENEAERHLAVCSLAPESVPALHQVITVEEKTYLLMEYIEGEDLCGCNRKKLICALDALIAMQEDTWELEERGCLAGSFLDSLHQRQHRGEYLMDAQLEEAYDGFLRVYQAVPKALCHDDLLPFNVICSDEKAYFIDWECGGMLPYPTSLARLIAHGEEKEDALFCMSEEDKDFAIAYYYENLVKKKGISYLTWRNTLEYFLFYEYCEWVFVGNKYDVTDGEYYQKYLPMAKQQAAKVLSLG